MRKKKKTEKVLKSLPASEGRGLTLYESLYQALVAAHKLLPGGKDCNKKEADFRRKIRKLGKAVLKRQEKVAAREARGKASKK